MAAEPEPAPPGSAKSYSNEAWEAYRKIHELEAEKSGSVLDKVIYAFYRWIDGPPTWFRNTIVDPLREKNRLPYYHRKFGRGPTIDECEVDDHVCQHEANFQYRLDKQVDGQILSILRDRYLDCLKTFDHEQSYKCVKLLDVFEANELNFFIKYGEMGLSYTAIDAYMKQKHRMIWERRHPEVMEVRKTEEERHQTEMDAGHFNYNFWKTGQVWQDKQDFRSKYRGGMWDEKVYRQGPPSDYTPLRTKPIWGTKTNEFLMKQREEWFKEKEAREAAAAATGSE